MRKFVFSLIFFAVVWAFAAGEPNYYCVVCGKGPLTGRIWMSKWGPICDDCAKLPTRCSICGLPIRDGDGSVKTGDGRFICRFDKTNAVLDLDQAKELFADTRSEVVEMYGQGFALQNPDVTVNLFDVDYWSEKGREDGLHKFGFASSRPAPDGAFTHEVVMLSGRLRDEMFATAAHEYTHLWINENRPAGRYIDSDTIEAICELTAYKLMGEMNLPEMQQRILDNPYTHGQIKTLIQVEADHGIGYILDWVKNGTTPNFGQAGSDVVAPGESPATTFPPVMVALPKGLKFTGLLVIGNDREAVIDGTSFAPGDEKRIRLQNKTVTVLCREIQDADVVVQVNGSDNELTLQRDQEKAVP
jgi:hypothetical protein